MKDTPSRPQLVSEAATELYRQMVNTTQPHPVSDVIALAELLALGLVREDRVLGYVVVDPSLVVARQAAEVHRRIADDYALAATLSDEFDALREAFLSQPRSGGGGVEYLRGASAINARLVTLLAGAKSEIISCQPGGPRSTAAREFGWRTASETLARGVVMRTLYQEEARSGEGMDEWVLAMTELGTQVRTLNELFSRMIIIDRQTAVLPDDENLAATDEAIAYVVHDPGLASFLVRQFERDWTRAIAWSGPEAPGALSATDVLILQGLAADDTLAAIGRRLGLRRQVMDARVKALKLVLGAENQFQLGMRYEAYLRGAR